MELSFHGVDEAKVTLQKGEVFEFHREGTKRKMMIINGPVRTSFTNVA